MHNVTILMVSISSRIISNTLKTYKKSNNLTTEFVFKFFPSGFRSYTSNISRNMLKIQGKLAHELQWFYTT